jgi:hypothetical protein
MGVEHGLPEQSGALPPNRDAVIDSLRRITEEDAFLFEMELERMGLLTVLEEASILPLRLEPPNPFDPETQEEQFLLWEQEHPEETEAFSSNLAARDAALKHLYIGAVLRHSFADLFSKQQET